MRPLMANLQTDNLQDLLAPAARRVEAALTEWLTDPAVPAALGEAMRYSCLAGGKRLRPALVLLTAEAVAPPAQWRADPVPAAVAVEMVHCYSLVHDDLPAMDNDTLRRGRPTTHVAFGHAMAILAGDALLTRAFEVLARRVSDKALAAELVAELALAAGPAGMIAGQVADMDLCPVPEGLEGCSYIHLRKTAALIRSAVRMGGLCAGAAPDVLIELGAYGEKLGLAFQVADDLLDATSASAVLGKTPGKDAQAGKRTYPDLLGADGTTDLVARISQEACGHLGALGGRACALRQLAQLLAGRDR
jgi:geranylgeranyl diphosphate synthase type II